MHGVFLFLPGLYGYVMGCRRFLESPYTQLYLVFLTHGSKDKPIRNTYAKDQQNPSCNTGANIITNNMGGHNSAYEHQADGPKMSKWQILKTLKAIS